MYREALQKGIALDGARVRASGALDGSTWLSSGIGDEIDVASEAGDDEIERLLLVVDDVAEIPKAVRVGTTVTRDRPGA